MKLRAGSLILIIISSLTLPLTAFAATGDLELVPGSVQFSNPHLSEGRKTRIYSTVKNNSSDDLYGVVRFVDTIGPKQIGTDQPISAFSRRTDDVFVDWIPSAGEHDIRVQIIPWQNGDNSGNNMTIIHVSVIADLDGDGVADGEDTDIDGDGTINSEDAFPRNPKEWIDTDGDGIGNNADTDDDNDGVIDTEDAFPLDPKESKDTDIDGIGDNADTDIDGDTVSNDVEVKNGTDPKKTDTDGDGVPDNKDAFPLDPKESKDTDHDGIGDNADTDIDGDGITNTQDSFPKNIAPVANDINVPFVVKVGDTIHLDASSSIDPDGKIETAKWVVDGKTVYKGIAVDIKVETPGSHQVELQITDNNGETKTKSFNLYGTASVLLTQGGLLAAAIALALLGFFYYITRASKRRAKQHKAEHHE